MARPLRFERHGIGIPTTVNIPGPLQGWLTEQADRRGISRSQLITEILLRSAVQQGYRPEDWRLVSAA